MKFQSIFDPRPFKNPPNIYRPLQIIHGYDAYLKKSSDPAVEETDPAGQWSERLAEPNAPLDGLEGVDAHLEKLARMGSGGVVTNVGFTDYLESPQQWELLRYGMRRSAEKGLRLWLYDEKGYPSGGAGGIVTRANPEYASLGLACYTLTVHGPAEVVYPMPVSCRRFVWAGASQDGCAFMDISHLVDSWGVLRWKAPAGEWTVLFSAERVSYEGTHAANNVSEFKHFVNLLDKDAVKAFIRVTHEAYKRELPPELWGKVEAIFTDEPSLMIYYLPDLPQRYIGKVPVFDKLLFKDRPPAVPWVHGFLDQFKRRKGYDLRPLLHALFYPGGDGETAEKACFVRQDYYDVVTQLYTDAFYVQVQDWCHANGVASSGHVLLEENILDHVAFHGSMFAVLRHLDLPGIDMLNSDPQKMMHDDSYMGYPVMTIKQVTSAAHIAGNKRIHSESSDWEQHNAGKFATLAERIGQGNLQYVLGINQITSYFGWAELSDADWKTYSEYMGRLGLLLYGGSPAGARTAVDGSPVVDNRHICDVAVLYPIRSMWAHYLPPLQPITNWRERHTRSPWVDKISQAYPALVRHLLLNQVDLDIIDEEAILEGSLQDGVLSVADEAYRCIVLPPLDALSLQTVEKLEAFCKGGGVLLSIGDLPSLAESASSTTALRQKVADLFAKGGSAHQVTLEALPDAIRQALQPDLVLDTPNREIMYTHRLVDGRHVYFIINNAPEPAVIQPKLRQAGPYTLYIPATGNIQAAPDPLILKLGGYEGVFVVV